MPSPRLTDVGFVLAGNYPESDPARGLAAALRLFEFGEQLGFQVAGIRQRQLEPGVSSALTVLAAASQRTRHIHLESSVVPIGYETPFRLAEDFATVDALSGGRINVGISSSAPHPELLARLGRDDDNGRPDAYELLERFLAALDGEPLSPIPIATPFGPQIPAIHPHIPQLRSRVWIGGGSARSIRWAAAAGLKLLLGNLTGAEGHGSFEAAQRAHIDDYFEHYIGDDPAVGVERVIVPTDSASREQADRYAAFATSREERTVAPINGTVFQRDLIGSSEQIIERLRTDPSIDGRTAVRVALPYALAEDDYRQILSDIRYAVLPTLGWSPREHQDSQAATSLSYPV